MRKLKQPLETGCEMHSGNPHLNGLPHPQNYWKAVHCKIEATKDLIVHQGPNKVCKTMIIERANEDQSLYANSERIRQMG